MSYNQSEFEHYFSYQHEGMRKNVFLENRNEGGFIWVEKILLMALLKFYNFQYVRS